MTASGPVGVGVVGAGMISDTYLRNLQTYPDVRVVAVGDRDRRRAESRAAEHGVPDWGSPTLVFSHPDVEIVVNLTVPAAHPAITSAAIAAGKHVWSEKPLGTDRAAGQALLRQAAAAGMSIGVAPDTVYSPGLRAARLAIARGDIGVPLAARTVMQYAGPELFHPSPEFLFAEGAGPLYDVGPYYITALVHILGPVATVSAVGTRGRTSRTIEVGDRRGTDFPVDVPTHVAAIAAFRNGAISESTLSFESPRTEVGTVEITGTEGTIMLPDPNLFSGLPRITRTPANFAAIHDEPLWEALPAAGPAADRGAGVVDLARCVRNGTRVHASAEVGYHVLDTIVAMNESLKSGSSTSVTSTVEPVPMLPEDWDPSEATL